MEQQPGQRQGGRPPAGDGRSPGGRSPHPGADYVEDDPTMVRPFVESESESEAAPGRPGRQGADGRNAQGGQATQNGRTAQNNRTAQDNRTAQNGRNRQNAPNVPGPRPPRENHPQQVPGLLSNPMPPPRAVAGRSRPDVVLHDLTTTMPILVVPSDDLDGRDGYEGYEDGQGGHGHDRYGREFDNAPPGEHGHYHDDADLGRHRGRNRPPRALKAAGLVAGLVAVGVAAYSVLGGGGSSTPAAGPAAATTSSGAAGGAPSDGAAAAVAGAPAPTGTPTDTGSGSSPSRSASPSRTTKPASKSSSSSHPPTTGSMSSQPSSAASTTTTGPAVPPPSPTTATATPTPTPTTPSASTPTFTTLGPGSSGPAVTQLQQELQILRYYWGNLSGTYDSNTQHAVSRFQSANPGTSPPDKSGTYGPATDKALRQALGG